MNELEPLLRKALARRDPPGGFTGRVMARIEPAPRPIGGPLGWVAAAAVVVLVAAGVWIDSDLRRRAEGERAKQEVLTALRVTGSALNAVSDELSEARSRRVETDRN